VFAIVILQHIVSVSASAVAVADVHATRIIRNTLIIRIEMSTRNCSNIISFIHCGSCSSVGLSSRVFNLSFDATTLEYKGYFPIRYILDDR
jgi:hypothetical protein